ncbi:MAG: hypothetical protein ACREU3_09545 [Steroidobacteraceae bacterium]
MQEQPHFKRSALWRREPEITAWLKEGYSFRQIADELTSQGTKVSARWLQEWYAKNVGRRRVLPQDESGRDTEPPASSASLPPTTNTLRSPGKRPPQGPSSAPTAPATPAPIDPDVSALFQSQFKRPRR